LLIRSPTQAMCFDSSHGLVINFVAQGLIPQYPTNQIPDNCGNIKEKSPRQN